MWSLSRVESIIREAPPDFLRLFCILILIRPQRLIFGFKRMVLESWGGPRIKRNLLI